MGAPSYKKTYGNKVFQYDLAEEKREVNRYKELIKKKIDKEDQAKKAALIIEELLRNKPKRRKPK